jgi:predicted XRE-type DNA-binding protein
MREPARSPNHLVDSWLGFSNRCFLCISSDTCATPRSGDTKPCRKSEGNRKMSNVHRVRHVTPASGNVFVDLGFPPREAARLLKAADAAIDARRAIKLVLMDTVPRWIEEHDLTQAEASIVLKVTRPRVSDIVNRKVEKFTIDALVELVARTGRRVSIAVT